MCLGGRECRPATGGTDIAVAAVGAAGMWAKSYGDVACQGVYLPVQGPD